MPDDLRTRIAAALQRADEQCASLALADAVIRELDGKFLDFALWLSEELRGEPTGKPMSDRYESIPDWVAVDFVRCVECGVLIDNTRVHDRWHDRKAAADD